MHTIIYYQPYFSIVMKSPGAMEAETKSSASNSPPTLGDHLRFFVTSDNNGDGKSNKNSRDTFLAKKN